MDSLLGALWENKNRDSCFECSKSRKSSLGRLQTMRNKEGKMNFFGVNQLPFRTLSSGCVIRGVRLSLPPSSCTFGHHTGPIRPTNFELYSLPHMIPVWFFWGSFHVSISWRITILSRWCIYVQFYIPVFHTLVHYPFEIMRKAIEVCFGCGWPLRWWWWWWYLLNKTLLTLSSWI